MKDTSIQKPSSLCTFLVGAAVLAAVSGCAPKTGQAGPGTQIGASAPVNAGFGSSASSASASSQAASGLVYDRPYVWAQPADSNDGSGSDGSGDQRFYKYVFHQDGTCECYQGVRKSWLGPSDKDDGGWTLLIGNAPFEIKSSSSGSSIRVDWSKCQPETPCGKAGADSTDAFFDIQSAGFRLLDTSDQSFFTLQRPSEER